MINELIKLATHLDSKGLTKEADYLDAIIKSAYCKPPMVWNNDLNGCMSPNLGEGSTSYTTKEEDHCAAKGLTKGPPQYNKCITQTQNRLQAGKKLAADRNYRMIKTAIGPSSYTAKVLRRYGLGEEYYINTAGDPYKYVYVPPEKGGPKFLITSGKINTSFFDSAGNATKTVSIKKGRPGYDNLIQRLPDDLKPVEESPPQAQTGDLTEYRFKGLGVSLL